MMPEKTIITSESSNSSPLNPSPSLRIICHVCNKQFSQYTCPRCNFRYCSLSCYKSHSVQCTESFMRDNVNDELRQVRSDDQTKTKMLEILKRFHSEEEGEDEGIDSITDDEGSSLPEEIIQKIMNGDEVNLDDLSLEEKKGFQRALASGELSKMIEPWDPWWLRASARTISLGLRGTQLVQSVEGKEEEEATLVSEIPRGPDTPLISLSKLSSTNPSPLLPLHLIDILYSSCFTLRIYNGEWQSDSLGSATMVLTVSSVLGHNAQPETIKEVLSFCLEQTCSSAYRNLGGGLKFGLNLVDDVICLLFLGSAAMVCLLCDLQRLILAAIQEVKSPSSGRELKKKLKLAERKVYFMMCWVNEQSSEVWQALESSVRAEKNKLVELNDCKGFPEMKKKDQIRKGSSVVIEEIE